LDSPDNLLSWQSELEKLEQASENLTQEIKKNPPQPLAFSAFFAANPFRTIP
jgi:hypothetical protein